jgi:hypothetical protein
VLSSICYYYIYLSVNKLKYKKSIAGYAQIEEPLIQLTHRNVNFSWGAKEQKAFDTL